MKKFTPIYKGKTKEGHNVVGVYDFEGNAPKKNEKVYIGFRLCKVTNVEIKKRSSDYNIKGMIWITAEKCLDY